MVNVFGEFFAAVVEMFSSEKERSRGANRAADIAFYDYKTAGENFTCDPPAP